MSYQQPTLPRMFCHFCGAEIAAGEAYWRINSVSVCGLCLPEFARQEYHNHLCVYGKEACHDAGGDLRFL